MIACKTCGNLYMPKHSRMEWCSDGCREDYRNARRTLALRLLTHMEKHAPAALAKIEKHMRRNK